jgi:hypothetical protein
MDHFGQIQAAKTALRCRLELLREVVPKIQNIAETEGKRGVARYFSDRFGIEPKEQGTDLLFKEWRFRFDESGAFIGMSSGSGSLPRAIRKSDSRHNRKNDI